MQRLTPLLLSVAFIDIRLPQQLMGDIILMLERRGSEIDAPFVKSQIDDSTTVVSAQVPSYSPEFGMVREEWTGAHHQHGVDLARLDNDLRLRDIVLVTIPEPSTSRLGLLHVWTSPKSTYDIDAVRIPWDEVKATRGKLGEGFVDPGGAERRDSPVLPNDPRPKGDLREDPRNNSEGKNPTNFWFFSKLPSNKKQVMTLMDVFGTSSSAAEEPTTLSSGIELDAFRRIMLAHSKETDTILVWADDDDYGLLSDLTSSLNRTLERIQPGECDEFVPIPIIREELPVENSGQTDPIVVHKSNRSGHRVTVTAKIQDCRTGIEDISGNSISHVVTSPPYNIGYKPFNDPKPNSSGQLVAPVREGYDDDLSPEQYASLLESCFEEIDTKADPDVFDLYLNIKSNYSGGSCDLPFYMLELMPDRWRLLDVLIWRYDISFDPGRGKYKPLYEWVIRVGYGDVDLPELGMLDWYIPILKGNSKERKILTHPAMFPCELVERCLRESNRPASLVLDPFLGSGTTLRSCLVLGVNGLGFEINANYVQDIKNRLDMKQVIGDGNLKRA